MESPNGGPSERDTIHNGGGSDGRTLRYKIRETHKAHIGVLQKVKPAKVCNVGGLDERYVRSGGKHDGERPRYEVGG